VRDFSVGEAKRRREAEAARAATESRHPSGLTFAEIEQIASEDPDDRADRLAHGIPYEARHDDPAEFCRNGCGLSYSDIVAGKIRLCRAALA
jgi:hypothetical protein